MLLPNKRWTSFYYRERFIKILLFHVRQVWKRCLECHSWLVIMQVHKRLKSIYSRLILSWWCRFNVINIIWSKGNDQLFHSKYCPVYFVFIILARDLVNYEFVIHKQYHSMAFETFLDKNIYLRIIHIIREILKVLTSKICSFGWQY